MAFILFQNRGTVHLIELWPCLNVIIGIVRLSLFIKRHPIFLVLFMGKPISHDVGIWVLVYRNYFNLQQIQIHWVLRFFFIVSYLNFGGGNGVALSNFLPPPHATFASTFWPVCVTLINKQTVYVENFLMKSLFSM